MCLKFVHNGFSTKVVSLHTTYMPSHTVISKSDLVLIDTEKGKEQRENGFFSSFLLTLETAMGFREFSHLNERIVY